MTARRTERRRVPVGVPAVTIMVLSAPAMLARLRLPKVSLAALAAAATWSAAGVTLFVVYLHVARTSAITSDGASNALQAWDMLHGNPLLRGWALSDVSFYTTELPQYVLIEYLRGPGPGVIHLASAMTYTIVILLAALAAKGRATGRAAIAACVLAAGIMAAPQAGAAVFVLLGSPDHMGSTVPVLTAFLIAGRAPRRWYTPLAVAMLLCAGLIADGIVAITGIGPVVVVSVARLYRDRFRLGRPWRSCWFEAELAGAALAGAWLARMALAAIAGHGGFLVWPVSGMLASAGDLPRYLMNTVRGLLLLFGADFLHHQAGLVAALAAVHLVGLGLAAWATCAVLRRPGKADLAAQLLAAGVVLTLAAYLFGTRAGDLLAARDITAVLPFGAALAGRVLADRLASARLLPALGVALACYLVSLGQVVIRPPATPSDAPLASWLTAHHLTDGLADYWDANVMTLQTGGQVRLRSVAADGTTVTRGTWEARSDWYDPTANYANFLVLRPGLPGFNSHATIASARKVFGQPLRIYNLGTYTILIWNKNLLADLIRGEKII